MKKGLFFKQEEIDILKKGTNLLWEQEEILKINYANSNRALMDNVVKEQQLNKEVQEKLEEGVEMPKVQFDSDGDGKPDIIGIITGIGVIITNVAMLIKNLFM